MEFDALLAARHSVRNYTQRPLSKAQITAILEAARCAPSACNSQTWRFVAVTDGALIGEICRSAMRPIIPNRWLAQAPLLIVGGSKLDLVANRLGGRITGIEYYQVDLGIAMQQMALKATDLGLGSCWIGWFKESVVKALLQIPDGVKVSALLAVGYPAAAPQKPSRRKALAQIAFENRWGASFKP